VVIDDFNTETRFKVPAFLREHGINSGISIIIQGQEHPYGVLGAHTIKPRSFTKDEVYFLLAVANILGTAIERARMQAALRNLSLTDELTGLCNRRGFLALAEQHLKLARRLRRSVCLVFADLDDLKQINDTLGHQCGDEALVKTAEVLRETFRHSDILGRLGGDEFMALAMEDSKQTPAKILNRLQQNLEAQNAHANLRFRLSLSAGAARLPATETPVTIEEMIAKADQALYKQKRSKRNRGRSMKYEV
jgi:diguanylate cyclase (GGDEF)-like protein